MCTLPSGALDVGWMSRGQYQCHEHAIRLSPGRSTDRDRAASGPSAGPGDTIPARPAAAGVSVTSRATSMLAAARSLPGPRWPGRQPHGPTPWPRAPWWGYAPPPRQRSAAPGWPDWPPAYASPRLIPARRPARSARCSTRCRLLTLSSTGRKPRPRLTSRISISGSAQAADCGGPGGGPRSGSAPPGWRPCSPPPERPDGPSSSRSPSPSSSWRPRASPPITR